MIGFEVMAAAMAVDLDGSAERAAAAQSRAKEFGRQLERMRVGRDRGEPLRRQAERALLELLTALAAVEVRAAEARGAAGRPSFALANAAFAATRAVLAPQRGPWTVMSEQEALRALLPRKVGPLAVSPQQRAVLDAWRHGSDAVVLLPTGAGKSLTFLLPALMSAGGALVVSPLRALMRAMVEHGLPEGVGAAAAVDGSAGGALLRYAAGAAQVLFVAPESLEELAPLLRWACARRGCTIMAVDEAHMALPEPVGVQGYRPAYGSLPAALDTACADLLPGTCMRMALTATATSEEAHAELALACGLRDGFAMVWCSAVRLNLVLRTLVADGEGSGVFMSAIARLLGVDLTGAGIWDDPEQLEAVRAELTKLAALPSWRRRFGAAPEGDAAPEVGDCDDREGECGEVAVSTTHSSGSSSWRRPSRRRGRALFGTWQRVPRRRQRRPCAGHAGCARCTTTRGSKI